MGHGEGAVGSEHAWILGGADGALTLPVHIALGMSPCVLPRVTSSPAAVTCLRHR